MLLPLGSEWLLPAITDRDQAAWACFATGIEPWRASSCKETPKRLGYCADPDLHAKHILQGKNTVK